MGFRIIFLLFYFLIINQVHSQSSLDCKSAKILNLAKYCIEIQAKFVIENYWPKKTWDTIYFIKMDEMPNTFKMGEINLISINDKELWKLTRRNRIIHVIDLELLETGEIAVAYFKISRLKNDYLKVPVSSSRLQIYFDKSKHTCCMEIVNQY